MKFGTYFKCIKSFIKHMYINLVRLLTNPRPEPSSTCLLCLSEQEQLLQDCANTQACLSLSCSHVTSTKALFGLMLNAPQLWSCQDYQFT